MNSVIFRTITPLIVVLTLMFSAYVTLRGHNEPGGGFIGGLVAASAIAILGIAFGPAAARRALRYDPLAIAGGGLTLSACSGLVSIFIQEPFLTSLWFDLDLGETVVSLSTPMIFDIGVYLVVLGTVSAVVLALESDQGDAG
jgi:multicomponent Na+:H+ antiporter subunit B